MAKRVFYFGVDTSIHGTGLALIGCEDKELTSVRLGTVRTDDLAQLGDKYLRIQTAVTALLKQAEEQESDDGVVEVHAAIEGGAYGASGSIFELGGAWGCALASMALMGVHPTVVPPASLKMYACGNGSASKEDVKKAICAGYGIDESKFEDDNQSDAAALALYAYTKHTGKAHTSTARRAACKQPVPKQRKATKRPKM